MNNEEYRKKIELEILSIIEERLKEGKINAQRAKEIAKFILDTLHPNMDINQIYHAVQNFNKHFSELIPVAIQVSNDYEEKMKKIVIQHVDNLIKQNKIDDANDLLKKAINKEVKITE